MPGKKPRIGVIVDDITIHKWETNELLREISRQGHKAVELNIYRSPLDVEERNWGFDYALARTMGSTPFRVEAIKAIEISGIKVVNAYRSIRQGGDKYVSLINMRKLGLHIPRTMMVSSFESAVRAISQIGTPVVLKPVVGTYGQGLFRIFDLEKELEFLDGLAYPYLVQEYIPHKEGDIRVFVCGDKALGAMTRIAPQDEWKTNVSTGGQSKKHKMDEELKETAVNAAKAIGASYGGVDIMKKDGKYHVIEVNTQADFKGFYRTIGINPAKDIVDLLFED
ncbi:RimK family alpha-L-glutamate ligase [Candidatus Altiarchaeota archaeon]